MLKRFSILTQILGVTLLGSSMLVGCGQKGPLYLPVENEPTELSTVQVSQQTENATEVDQATKVTQGDSSTAD
ncbi:LPS translocon maturation chaperone LptM [Alkalimarinus alittae]|uniref:Lipoprotein n=1 Tax=Alkalimarinus alittae TaxID=2961619 RepID=A0ABY6N2W6_9ALTE|nr:lipoprotein [Alkalimarinus alittae]UZE96458.1 lipoprotein [Alkalimarinus alittae]